MADCEHCRRAIFKYGAFWECGIGEYVPQEEECEAFDEYTSEDAYWDKYAANERKGRYED